MRRIITVANVILVALLAAGIARADLTYYSQVYITNWNNGGGLGHGNSASFLDPAATTDGAVWLDRGTGPVLNVQDFNMQIEYSLDSTASWTPLLTAPILLNGPDSLALHDVNVSPSATTVWGSGDSDPLHDGNNPANTTISYYSGYFVGSTGILAGAFNVGSAPTSRVRDSAYFRIWGWTGNYNTYAEAEDASKQGHTDAFVGHVEFLQTQFDFGPDNSQYGFTDMPALVLGGVAHYGRIPGDANLDRAVNIIDLNRVLTNYDKGAMGWENGDFTADGYVNVEDLNKVLTNYDKTFSTASPNIGSVPEPSGLALLAIGAAGLVGCARRRRR